MRPLNRAVGNPQTELSVLRVIHEVQGLSRAGMRHQTAIASHPPDRLGLGMRARVLLWTSLALNLLLATAVLYFWRAPVESVPVASGVQAEETASKPGKTRVVVRRQGFSWSEVESADFATYIKNLRNIGCPEHTIRDIILAEVNELYSDRLTRELNLPEQKWWLPEPDMDVLQEGMDQVRAMETEKAQLLTQLLGPGWETQKATAGASAIRFDGPVLTQLPTEARAAVERIESEARRARNELQERARQENRSLSAEELNRLRQHTRTQLAAVMNPQQLEEYLLRYSGTADQLRDELRGFGADADEFRRIFRVRDNFDQQIAAVTGVDDASVARRRELTRLRDLALSQEIGPERFGLYQLSQSPLFREAQQLTEQRGGAAEKVLPILRIKQAVAEETARIQADTALSEDQRRVALAAVQQQQQNSIDRILTDQRAEETASVEQTTEAAAQRVVEAPPFPPFPGAPGSDQPSRAGLPPGADLPPGVNASTRGPAYRGRAGALNPIATPTDTSKGPAYPPRRR